MQSMTFVDRFLTRSSWLGLFTLLFALSACGGGAAAPASSAAPTSAAAGSQAAKPSAAASGPAAGSSGQLRKITLAWATQTAVFLPPHVGIQAGIFKNHGIDLNLLYTGS